MIAIQWLAITFIVFGIVLNNRQDHRGFYLWIIANLLKMIVHLSIGLPVFAAGDFVFLLLAIKGLQNWHRIKEAKNG